jgi:hypothetical protein
MRSGPKGQLIRVPSIQLSRAPHIQLSRAPHIQLSRAPHIQLSRAPHIQLSRALHIQLSRAPYSSMPYYRSHILWNRVLSGSRLPYSNSVSHLLPSLSSENDKIAYITGIILITVLKLISVCYYMIWDEKSSGKI